MDASLALASFIAGFLTILAPCILPLLPVVIGGSLGGKASIQKPLRVIASLCITIVIFTLIVEGLASLVYIPQDIWRTISASLILIVGITFLFPTLWISLPFIQSLSKTSNKTLGKGVQKKSWLGDVMVGVSLGPVFSTCSPTYFLILATILPKSFFEGLIYLLIFVAGLSITLLLIALVGDVVLQKLNLLTSKGVFKKSIGVILIVVAFAIYTNSDKALGTFLIENNLFIDTTQLEILQ